MKKETRDLICDKLWKVMVALAGISFVLFVISTFLYCAFITIEDKTIFSLMLKLIYIIVVIAITDMFCIFLYNLLEYTKPESKKRRKELNALILKVNDDGYWKRQQIRYDYLCTRYRRRLQNKKI